MTPCSLVYGDSLREYSELITTNHAIIYRRNWNLVSTYFGRRGDNWVSLRLQTQPDTTLRVVNAVASVGIRASQTQGNGANRPRSFTNFVFHSHIIAWFVLINSRPPLSVSFYRKLPTFRKQIPLHSQVRTIRQGSKARRHSFSA
jgi:hypothetical protein